MNMRKVYLDNASTTAVDKRVLEKMLPYFSTFYGNANSQHSFGREALKAVDEARDVIALILGVKSNEIYFTSGGTESDNWALKGVAYANRERGNHIIVSAIEHPAVLDAAKQLEQEGFSVSYIPVNSQGIIDLKYLENEIRKDTVLVSCMLVNNEIGTIQPIKEVVEIAKKKGVLVHTDCVQAMSSLPVNVGDLGVDLLSFSSHKINGPKGVGVLYVKGGTKIEKLIVGGHQERRQRGGTLNVAGIVGMAEALRLTALEMEENTAYVKALRDDFVAKVESEIKGAHYNGSKEFRVVSNANFSFDGISDESALFLLDLKGIAVSSGSACTSGSLEPSHVLKAIGVSEKTAQGSIRFSFGKENTRQDVDYTVQTLKEIIAKLRETV